MIRLAQMMVFSIGLGLAVNAPVAAISGETPSAPGSMVYFVNLKNNDTVKSPVKIIFGLKGMGIAPAGIEAPNTGHHHILLDRAPFGEGEEGKSEFDGNIFSDENHIHFGKGQTETTLDLQPGIHTIQLVFGDKDHIPHNPPLVSEVITINVE